MSRMTGQDFVTNIRGLCGGETTETLSDTKILRTVNQEILRIVSRYNFLQTAASTSITTASGTAEYELSVSDILRITTVHDSTSGLVLPALSEEQYYDSIGTTASTGPPSNWFMSGIGSNGRWQITLWPTPAGVYTVNVYYRQVPDELVISPTATSSNLPESWDSVIEWMAASKCWVYLHDAQQAALCLKLGEKEESAAAGISRYASDVPIRPQSIAGWHGR